MRISKQVIGHAAALAAALILVSGAGCQSGAEITTDHDECAQDIEDGLDNLRALNQLQFNVRAGDGHTVINEGSITNEYRRRGVRHEVSFRPQTNGDQCELVFYRRVERESGSRHTSTGNFGSYTLNACDCTDPE